MAGEATARLEQVLLDEARLADEHAERDDARLLRRLAATTANMTPGERKWVEQASDSELRGFARAIHMGCEREGE